MSNPPDLDHVRRTLEGLRDEQLERVKISRNRTDVPNARRAEWANGHQQSADALSFALDRLAETPGWRPIADAEKQNGLHAIVFADGLVGEAEFDCENPDDPFWRWEAVDPFDALVDEKRRIQPTHFQPLPAPPQTGDE